MNRERYNMLMKNDEEQLTPEEIAQGYHFCWDWDGLLIGPGMGEMEHCRCPGFEVWREEEIKAAELRGRELEKLFSGEPPF